MVVSPDLLAGLTPFPFAVGQMVTPLRFALISIAIDLVLSVSGFRCTRELQETNTPRRAIECMAAQVAARAAARASAPLC
jgi:hypothetical protein